MRDTTEGRIRHRRAAMLIAALVLVASACGDDDEPAAAEPSPSRSTADVEPAGAATSAPETTGSATSGPETTGSAASGPEASRSATSVPETAGSDEVPEALVIGSVDVASNLVFLTSDGAHLWATGRNGLVVRIDPSDGTVEELTVSGIDGQLLPTVADDDVWLAELGGNRVLRVDPVTFAADPPVEVGPPVGLIVAGPDDRLWIEASEPPAGLRPFDPTTTMVGDLMVLDESGEIVGSAAGFGSLWVPRFEANEIVRLDLDGRPGGTVATGVGPANLRAVGDDLWFVNRIDGTLGRLDAGPLDVLTVDLNADGPAIESPGAVVATGDAVWTLAASTDGGTAILFRIDPTTGDVIARRAAPRNSNLHAIGGLAAVGDRLFLLVSSTGELLELDTEDFTTVPHPDRPTATTIPLSPDEIDVRTTVETLFASSTTPEQMAELIEDGATLTMPITAFRQFFADNFPGEDVAADVVGVRVDGDSAEADYLITVSGGPVIDQVQTGSLTRTDGTWRFDPTSFCELVALGGVPCPA